MTTLNHNNNKPLSDESEKLLIHNIARGQENEKENGHEDSLKTIIGIYEKRIRAFASIYASHLGEEVDDLAQDIFLQIYIASKKFKGDSLVKTWIYSIAKFTINNKLRKKKLLYFWQFGQSKNMDALEENLIDESNPERLIQESEQKQAVKKCLTQLDIKSQEVLMLYEWSGLSYEQISEILTINIGTVKSRINTARNKLKEKLLMLNQA